MKKVLITGIDSFTGTHLAVYLTEQGYDVHGTSLVHSSQKKHKCDITHKKEIQTVLQIFQPDFLIHLSGISFAAHGKSEELYHVNTIGTLNILESCVELGLNPRKIILASSATAYGNQGLEVLDESLCAKPSNHYGASKYAMECLARGYFEALNILITRPFNYTGIGQGEHFLIPKIVKHFKEKKQNIELGNLDVQREFNDVSFVCEVYKRLLECDTKSQVLNIATNRGIKLLDVIETMNTIAGYTIQVDVNAAFVRKDEIKSLTGSSKKLFEAIGEVKLKDLKQTLQEMFEA